uniref:tRNA (5-methylaminomethyl-2-thiouridine)(34)-methyltransferase MnmD n=1 Tax=Comamonas sp. TaxID=34028 RepID=UPI0028A156E1
MTETVQWMADGTPYSPRFGDRYHSEAAHALAQAEQVFLAGCGLPRAWAGQPQWRILETGFGFGLNFLVTWHAWQQDPARPALLHFVSTEAFPIAAADLLEQARKFPHLLPLAEELAAQWWGLLPGVHRLRLAGGRVLLSLLVGDSQTMLRQHELVADSIYLDGFSPARNPDMWSLHTLKAVARCARRGTRLATWTIAAQLRRDLAQCGFEVRKVPGVPPKRDNLQASFAPHWEPRKAPLWPMGAQALPARLAGGGGHAAI